MTTKSLTICAAAAMILGSVTLASAGGGIQPPVETSTAPEHKVYICHLPGHEDDSLITGAGYGCVKNGGIILLVAKEAACKGHKIENACED